MAATPRSSCDQPSENESRCGNAAAHRRPSRSGIPVARVVIAGDSAGGGLTVAALVALRDAGDHSPFASILPEGQQALDRIGGFIRERVAAAGSP